MSEFGTQIVQVTYKLIGPVLQTKSLYNIVECEEPRQQTEEFIIRSQREVNHQMVVEAGQEAKMEDQVVTAAAGILAR